MEHPVGQLEDGSPTTPIHEGTYALYRAHRRQTPDLDRRNVLLDRNLHFLELPTLDPAFALAQDNPVFLLAGFGIKASIEMALISTLKFRTRRLCTDEQRRDTLRLSA